MESATVSAPSVSGTGTAKSIAKGVHVAMWTDWIYIFGAGIEL
jgi:hypothetical protein